MKTFLRSILSIGFIFAIGIGKTRLASADAGQGEAQDKPFFEADLSFKEGSLLVHAEMAVKPKVGAENIITLEFRNPETSQNVEITDFVEVSLWMPNMGHGSAPTTVEKAIDEKGEAISGIYRASDVYFTMAGDWDVNIKLTDADGQSETQTFKIQIKGGHHH